MIPIYPAKLPAAAARAAQAFNEPGAITLAALPPLSIYVHFPWCVKKCPYCDFNSHEPQSGTASIPEAAYLDALNMDLESVLPLTWGRRVHSVFIGGGTPSLLSEAGLDRLLADLRARLNLEADAEVTLEANPGTLEAGRFLSYRQSGVTRLSLGVQSLDDDRLRALGRIHDSHDARRAIESALQAFDNVNFDMMFALPGQQAEEAVRDLRELLSYRPQHVSLYHLSIEPNTVFAKYPPALPDDDVAALMQEALFDELARAGFGRYEISAFAQPDRRSRHNLNYWHFGDYLGIGPGAHGKLSFAHRIVRQVRVKQPSGYLERAARGESLFEETEVSPAELPFEFFLNALRLTEGVSAASFQERTGVLLGSIQPMLDEARARGLLSLDPTRLQATEVGLNFLNDLQSIFLPHEH